MTKRKKVSNTHKGKHSKVDNQSSPQQNEVSFDFTYSDWLRCVEVKGFTNKLDDEKEFAKYIFKVINEIIPYITENWHWIQTANYRGAGHNCHRVTEDKIEIVKKIIEETHSQDMDIFLDDESNIWQLGMQGALRLVVYYMHSSKTFFPLFVDYHHLIHPESSDKQSRTKHHDYGSKSFCPIEQFR